ncbi:hypothetical protein HYW20_00560 [Candidatus Woesearchaeota archaeon]|nr:hypothetical protein [Candidatus Woesearchaeota archaeon]
MIQRIKSRKVKARKLPMAKTEKHPIKRWEISVMEFQNYSGKKFKVTRRMSELSVAETKLFKSKKKAKKQFDEWLK